MILVLSIIFILIIAAAMWFFQIPPFHDRERSNKIDGVKYSNPSFRILKKYNALPASSKVMPELAIKLKSLDDNFGIDKVNSAYLQRSYDYSGYAFSWGQVTNGSKYFIYREIAIAIDGLQAATIKQAEVMQLAGIDKAGVKDILETIKGQTDIVQEVTKEIKRDIDRGNSLW